MKIAIVSDSIYPYNKGGKEKRIYEISIRLVKLGHRVSIYTMKWWEGPKQKEEDGLQLIGICKLKKLYTKERRRSITEAFYFGYKTFLPLLKADFDLLIVDHIPYLQLFTLRIVALLKRKLLIADWLEAWGKSNWVNYLGKTKGLLAYLVEKLSVLLPNRIFSISEFTSKKLMAIFNVPKNKIITIPCGIDLKEIKVAQENDRYISDCIFIGRLLGHKNVDVLLKSIKIIRERFKPNISCVIIGDGPEKKNLENLANKLNIEKNVIFCGFLKSHQEVYSYLKSSKIFTFPSTREGFGIVALEANACGLPVITAEHEDNAAVDLIQNGYNGYCINLNPEELAEYIIKILNDTELLYKLSHNSLKFSSNFSWDKITLQTQESYLGLLK